LQREKTVRAKYGRIIRQSQRTISGSTTSLACIKDSDAEAQTLHEIAVIEYRGGNLKLAAEHLTHAIKLFRDRQNKRGEASSVTELSNVYNFSGEPQKALDNYNEALVLARSIKDPSAKRRSYLDWDWY